MIASLLPAALSPVADDPLYGDVLDVKTGVAPEYRTVAMELVWRCLGCGLQIPRGEPTPGRCPSCGGPREDFAAVTED